MKLLIKFIFNMNNNITINIVNETYEYIEAIYNAI